MKILPVAAALLAAGTAHAANLPAFEVTCPNDLAVRAEAGGPVYINDTRAVLSKFSEQYYEAKDQGVTISVSLAADGSPTVTYTGKQGANGVCTQREENPQPEPTPVTEPQD